MKKFIVPTLFAFLCSLTLFACSAKSAQNVYGDIFAAPSAAADQYNFEKPLLMNENVEITKSSAKTYTTAGMVAPGESGTDIQGASAPLPDPLRKIIWTGEVNLETKSYDNDLEKLNLLVSECGGYVQSSSVTGGGALRSGERRMRSARTTLRIPSENFHLFMNGAAQIATLLSSSTDSNDITDSYFDTESRLGVLRKKEQRLIEMISRQGSLEELLKLENELSDTIYEIESLSGTLRKYDGLINYSTVTLYLNEVTEENATVTDEGTISRLSSSFGRSVSGLGEFLISCLVFVVGNSPVVIFVLLLGFGAFMLVRALFRKKKGKKQQQPTLGS